MLPNQVIAYLSHINQGKGSQLEKGRMWEKNPNDLYHFKDLSLMTVEIPDDSQ